jgi:putative two-component system response regulator
MIEAMQHDALPRPTEVAVGTVASPGADTFVAPNAPLPNPKIMIIDDESINIRVTKKYLQTAGYSLFVTSDDDTTAFELIEREGPDIVLLDILMPAVSGLEILQRMRQSPRVSKIPVLILTASTDRATKVRALELGATDFLAKPVEPSELVPRVRNALVIKAHHDHLEQYAERLRHEVALRTEELILSRRELIECLARAAEYRDENTGRHIIRVGKYAAALAAAHGLAADDVEQIEQASQLHDVGKIGIPDAILRKCGRLDPEEFALMKRHCFYGHKILQRLNEDEFKRLYEDQQSRVRVVASRSSKLVELAATIALTHHEWWDGSGYPHGLKGEDIPLPGRITALADVYDALRSPRPYKSAFTPEASQAIITARRGKQFDPSLVDLFVSIQDEIETIQNRLAD